MIDVLLPFYIADLDRCKQAECERQKEKIAALKLEISLLQRRQSTDVPAISTSAQGNVTSKSLPDDVIVGEKDQPVMAAAKESTNDNAKADN
jgi:hypothetical protein